MVNPTHFAVTLARAVELFRTKPDAVPDLKAAIRALVAITKMGGAIATFERGVISVDATVIPETLPSIITLRTQLDAHVVTEIRIARRASPADLLMLVRALASNPGPAADQRIQRLDRDKGATVFVKVDEKKKVPGRRPVSVTQAFEAEGILAADPKPTPVERPGAAPIERERPLAAPAAEERPERPERPAEASVGHQRPSAAVDARLRPSSGKVQAQPPRTPAEKERGTPATVDPERPLAAPAPKERPTEPPVGHQRPSAAVDARLRPITNPIEPLGSSAPPVTPESPSSTGAEQAPTSARVQQGADLDRRVAKLRQKLAEERELVERLRRSRRELEQRITDTEATVGERKGFVAHVLDWFRKEG